MEQRVRIALYWVSAGQVNVKFVEEVVSPSGVVFSGNMEEVSLPEADVTLLHEHIGAPGGTNWGNEAIEEMLRRYRTVDQPQGVNPDGTTRESTYKLRFPEGTTFTW